MKKLLKILLWIILVIVILLVLGVLALVFFVNPNSFKPQITKAFYQATGRQLSIPGKLSWTFYPNVGIKTDKVMIDNPAGYSSKTFAQIDGANISVALLPLLSSHIEVESLSLHGLSVNLIQKDLKHNNWHFGVPQAQPKTTSVSAKTTAHKTPAAKSATPAVSAQQEKITLPQFVIRQLDVRDANISFNNEFTHKQYTVHHIDFSARNIQLNKPFEIQLSFTAKGDDPQLVAKENLQAKLWLDQAQQRFSLQQMHLGSDVTITQPKQKPMHILAELQGNASVDMQTQQLMLSPQLTVNHILQAEGKLDVSHFLSAPQYHGKVTLAQFNLKALMQSLNRPLPTFPDKQALQRAALQAHFSGTTDSFKLSQLIAKVDQSQLKGNFSVDHFQAPTLTSQLSIDQLPVSHYLNLNGAQLPIDQVTLSSDLTMQGLTKATFPSSLNGNMSASIQSMTLKGVDLHAVVNDVGAVIRNLLKGQSAQDSIHQLQAQFPPKGEPINPNNGKQTQFGQFTLHESIHNGIMTAQQFTLQGPHLQVDGQGSINLNDQSINMLFDVYKPESANDGNPVLKVPYRMSGSLQKVESGIDWNLLNQRLVQLAAQAVGNSVKKSLDEKAKEFLGKLFHH